MNVGVLDASTGGHAPISEITYQDSCQHSRNGTNTAKAMACAWLGHTPAPLLGAWLPMWQSKRHPMAARLADPWQSSGSRAGIRLAADVLRSARRHGAGLPGVRRQSRLHCRL